MTAQIKSFQQEKARRDEQAQASQQRDAAAEELQLFAHFFESDEITGYCTTLTQRGAAWYSPRFSAHGVTIQGTETFRQLQYLRDQILDDIYDETADLAKTVREGKVSGAELQFTAAALEGDFTQIAQTADKLADKLSTEQEQPTGQLLWIHPTKKDQD